MACVFLQGEFLASKAARVSAFDAGFQHGVGLFETMTAIVEPPLNADAAANANVMSEEQIVQRTRILHRASHTRRLLTSCIELGLTTQLRAAPLEEAMFRTIARTHQSSAADSALATTQQRYRLRCTITGGDLNLLARTPGTPVAQEPTVLITAQPATQYPPAMFETGVPITLSDLRISPMDATASHKTLNYWSRLRELQKANARGASESLVLDVTNHVVGGCVSSAMIVKNGALHMPAARGEGPADAEATIDDTQAQTLSRALASAGIDAPQAAAARTALTHDGLPSCVLPGTTREWILAFADDEMIDVHLRPITMQDVLDADELILSNSSWGVLPVIALESHLLGKHTKHPGKPGAIARALRAAWLAL